MKAILSDKYFYYETYYISFGTKYFVIAATMTTETMEMC